MSARSLGRRLGGVALGAAILLAWLPSRSAAHGLDPAALLLREVAPGVLEVTWRASALRLPGADVKPKLPARCRQASPADATQDGDRVTLRWTVECGPATLAGETIGVEDLAAAKINALLRLERLDGEVVETVLSPRAPLVVVPLRATRWDVFRSYLALGVEHILTGPDHLLFVFGLLLLVSSPRLLLQTITAFTVGHSLTLSASALRIASVPSRPVEVLIAGSVLALAVDLAREADAPTLLRRFPWVMAVLFGLLHGFGFAGALAEAGLPPGDVPLALLSFNGGIEVGQLVFVALVLAAGTALARWAPGLAVRATRPAVYGMGILAAFWCFERLAVWLG